MAHKREILKANFNIGFRVEKHKMTHLRPYYIGRQHTAQIILDFILFELILFINFRKGCIFR